MKWLSLRLATLVLSVSVAILLAEGLVRLFAPAWLWRYRDATADWRRDPELGWTQKPYLDVKSRIAGRDWVVKFQTNPDGITPAVARRRRQPGTRRIMIFGNSTVLGRSVPRDRTVTEQLERLLNRCGVKTEVINAGVQGYSTGQVLLHIQRLAPLYRPDIVIYGFCLNDLGGIALRRAYGLPKPMFVTKARDQLELLPPELDRSSIPSFGRGPRKWLQFSALYRLLQPQILLIRSQMMSWEERNLLGLPDEIYYCGLAPPVRQWRVVRGTAQTNEHSLPREWSAVLFLFSPVYPGSMGPLHSPRSNRTAPGARGVQSLRP